MPVHVFRVLKAEQAARDDFLSDAARRKRPAAPWARRFPRLGAFIAEIDLPVGPTLLPFPDTPDHLTAFGDPDAFVHAVVRIVPVN